MRAIKICFAVVLFAFVMGAIPGTATASPGVRTTTASEVSWTKAWKAASAEDPLTATAMPASATTTCNPSTGIAHCVTTARREDGLIPCPLGWLCLYTWENWSEMQVRWQPNNSHPNFGMIPCPAGVPCDHNFGPGFNDEVTSWANNTGIMYCLNLDAAPGSTNNDMPPGTRGSNIGALWNDQASALSNQGC